MSVKIITDSTSDIDIKTREDLDITVVPLTIHFPDENIVDGQIPLDEFYEKLAASPVIPTSSQPSSGELKEIFERYVSEGHAVLAVFLSSKISGTYENALIARTMVLENYPEAQIEVVDSLNTVMALGYPVIQLAKKALDGASFEELLELTGQLLERIRFYFVPESLEHLRKGGRIGSAAALIGSVLDLKPVLYYADGLTAVARKVRSMKRAIDHMIQIVENDRAKYGLEAVIVQHINNLPTAREVAQTFRTKFDLEAPIVPVGPIVGVHAGPGTIGIAYCLARSS